jgi:glutamate synthase (NADPH/NADH)
VKLVAEVGVGTVAAGVAKAKADVILISGHDGGTGASPLTSIKHAGGPWELGLAETHQVLLLNDLRSRVAVETDGQLKTGRDVVVAALLGAEEFGFASAPLVSLGCIMMRVCHLNTCPAGIATQDPELRHRFAGKPEHVVNFMHFVATRGARAFGPARLPHPGRGRGPHRVSGDAQGHRSLEGQGRGFERHLAPAARSRTAWAVTAPWRRTTARNEFDDMQADPMCRPALDEKRKVRATLLIRNVNRTVGTRLGSEITRRYGPDGLPEDTIQVHFKGSAGQSFMAFVPKGVTFTLEGDANDYLGKGLSGGKLVVFPPAEATFVVEQNVIVGNVALYGATSGEVYIRGLAGERFCVRNSGANAVVEGVGDHGCEYMTGGRVVILGPTGRNFAAGMSGGIAYVLDENRELRRNCNTEMVGTGPLDDPRRDRAGSGHARRHRELTGSKRAHNVLVSWSLFRPLFVRVIPHDYRRVLEAQNKMLATGMSREEAEMAAFELNSKDAARFTESRRNGPANRISRVHSHRPRRPTTARARRRLCRVPQALAGSHHARAGRALHGLRRSLLPHRQDHRRPCQRLSAAQPDPEWNDLVYKGRWREAIDRLHRTNNFPEVTGRVCPAPCEGSCVLGINAPPVTIKVNEAAIADRAFAEGWVVASPPSFRTGKKVAVVGSGPAGLACAAELNHGRPLGHRVRARGSHRRPHDVRHSGHEARQRHRRSPDQAAGRGGRRVSSTPRWARTSRPRSCARNSTPSLCVAGSTVPRDLPVEGRKLAWRALRHGVPDREHQAPARRQQGRGGFDFRQGQERDRHRRRRHRHRLRGHVPAPRLQEPGAVGAAYASAGGARRGQPLAAVAEDLPRGLRPGRSRRHLRQGSAPVPGANQAHPWRRQGPRARHRGGGGALRPPAKRAAQDRGSARQRARLPADLVLLAMGFLGPEKAGLLSELGVKLDGRGNVAVDGNKQTSVPGVFAAGDMSRGQSLVVWAIAEGRDAAIGIDRFLMGDTVLE